jgi:replicative DNA helicase
MSAAAAAGVCPHSPEAERATLSAAMINPAALGEMWEILGPDAPEAFYEPAHRAVAEAIASLCRSGLGVDLVTVLQRLEGLGQLALAGGATGLADLAGASPTSANMSHYAGVVRDLWIRRRLQDLARVAHQRAQDTSTDLAVVLEGVERDVFALAHKRIQRPATQVREHLKEAYHRIEAAARGTGDLEGLTLGLPDLDRLTGGLKAGEVTIVAARPSVGKTAFALNVAASVVKSARVGVLIYSLEMTALQLTSRLLCLSGGVDVERIKSGFLGSQTISKAQWAAQELDAAPIWIDESVSLTPMELRARARRHAAQHKGLGLIVIDYLQLMHTSGRAENRQNEVSEISRAVKCVARELDVPVLCLSQLSRAAELGTGNGPQLAHLRDSGAIEQDADVVLMLSRPPANDRTASPNTLRIRVAKNRNGLTGDVEAVFLRNTQQVLPAAGAAVEARMPHAQPADDDGDYLS